MIEQKSQVLYEENIAIKGNEPFLRYGLCGLMVTLNAGQWGSHNLVERFGPQVPVCNLDRGDTFRIQLLRVHSGKVIWKDKIRQAWSWVKGLEKK